MFGSLRAVSLLWIGQSQRLAGCDICVSVPPPLPHPLPSLCATKQLFLLILESVLTLVGKIRR